MKKTTKSTLGYLGACFLAGVGCFLAYSSGQTSGIELGKVTGFRKGFVSGTDTLESAMCKFDPSVKEHFDAFHESAHLKSGE